ncbi:MAG TPA: ATP-binding protein [Solirubrobacteraceae bacterium]
MASTSSVACCCTARLVTGKTHTLRYLMSPLTDTTVVMLSGNALQFIAPAVSIARALQPALVIVEDVDLIAEARGMHPGQHPLLFQLLNEIDGLREDADVAFLLTTNRADLLEPALAQRPGRVDEAVELPLPDAEGRRQLLALYRGNLALELGDTDVIVAKTRGRDRVVLQGAASPRRPAQRRASR